MPNAPHDFIQAMQTGVMPDFPERGLYEQWDEHGNMVGYSDKPHHVGQPQCRFPSHWVPSLCFLAKNIADPIKLVEPPAALPGETMR